MLTRRAAIAATAALTALAAAWPAAAQDYPTKPIRMILPFAPGGSTDLIARLVAGQLTERLGKQVTVDNRPGAGGSIATEMAIAAPADGYTVLVVSMAHAINPHLYKLKYDVTKDMVPIAIFGKAASALLVHPSVEAKTVKEFLALAKAKPGSIHMGHAGIGSFQHLAVAKFAQMAKINIVEVPFKGGGPALVDVLGGHSQALVGAIISAIPHIRSGKLRALATSDLKRNPLLPDLPTIDEAGVPGYEAVNWFGMAAPKGTPQAVIDRLYKETSTALSTDAAKAQFEKDASEVVQMTSAEFGKYIVSQTEKWGQVIRDGNIKRQQ